MLAAANAVIVASGTATLETLLSRRPMVVAYRFAAFTAFVLRSLGLVKVQFFSQPNLLAGRRLVPEFLQEQVNGADLGAALLNELADPEHLAELQREFRTLHETLRRGGADLAATAILELVRGGRHVTLVAVRVRPPRRVAGVDEAGRGPLAGPVVAAAVILNPKRRIDGLADSKVLTAEERERLAPFIRTRALAWSVAWADRDEIDSLNILGATFLAMRRALLGLPVCPTHIQVDGNQLPRIDDLNLGCTAEAIIEGDANVAAISAASILAKTCRDAMMQDLDRCYPGFHLGDPQGLRHPDAP